MKKETILKWLSHDGLLSQQIKGFQERKEQIDLTGQVIDALTQKKIALLEAGTGVGKTYSYLLPAIYYAHTEKKKIAISTFTIQLQEQLIKKDIPHLLNLLGVDIEVNLILGMNNYLCLKRMNEHRSSLSEEIAAWSETTKEGRKPNFISKEMWEEVRVDSDTCIGVKCSHFKDCFFFKEREKAKNSQILIFNHHLLVNDLFTKSEKDRSFLPDYDWIVVDEAHHFEEVVRAVQGKKASYLDLIKLLNRLFLEGKSDGGRLNVLHSMIDQYLQEHAFKQKFIFDLPALKRETLKSAKDFYDAILFLMHTDDKRVVNPQLKSHILWQEVADRGKDLLEYLKQFATFLMNLDQEIKNTKDEKLLEKTYAIRFEIHSYANRLSGVYETLTQVLEGKEDVNEVSWFSQEREQTSSAYASKLDIAPTLQKILFKEKKGIVFMSATLSSGTSFDFLKSSLGVPEGDHLEGIYPSPFEWQKQALFMVPQDLPDPDSKEFLERARQVILDAVQATYGHALILFTSYGSLNQFYQALQKPLEELKYTPIRQGEKGKHELIELFKKSKSPILFGTDSFWEGIDIVGDALRLVVIVKLPFKAPDEPIVQALATKLKSEKKDPFFHYFLPQALVKFKQGFGRLIRHHEDRGVVLCLDHRIVSKNYGKKFLKALPDCQKEVVFVKEVREKIKNFFKRK